MLSVDQVTKRYRRGVLANDGVSLDVAAGEVFGLLGPNGAGKPTLVSQILGLLTPDSGTITIDGHDVVSRSDLARRWCSYQPQASAPVDGLTPREAIELVGRLRGGAKPAVRERAELLLEALDLGAVADRRVPASGGMARLTGFCMAAVVPGRVVILDEPSNDVDPLRRRALWTQVRALADDGAAVLLVTHNVVESERCVDRLAILAGGRVIAAGSPARLKADLGSALRLECTLETAPPPGFARAVPIELSIEGHHAVAQVQLADLPAAVRWAIDAQDQGLIAEFAVVPASLEDVYAAQVTA
jgi:ABC-2 type transport system ATP-binding protein